MTNNQRLTTLEENLGRVQDAQTRFATAQEQLTADVADLRVRMQRFLEAQPPPEGGAAGGRGLLPRPDQVPLATQVGVPALQWYKSCFMGSVQVLRLCDRHPAFGRRHLWASTSTSSYILKTYRKFVRHWFKK
ncbi:hypothetical protein LINPERHAP1_LOCUS21308 [Linum perenne]